MIHRSLEDLAGEFDLATSGYMSKVETLTEAEQDFAISGLENNQAPIIISNHSEPTGMRHLLAQALG